MSTARPPASAQSASRVEGWIDLSEDSPTAAPDPRDPNAALIATRPGHLVIRASAGSGKTYQLAIRYLRRLLDGAGAEEILASTFTRKAAGEIQGRILGLLAKAARDAQQLRQLAGHLGEPSLDRARCLHLLKELTASLHRMRVGTLDSLFSRLATSFTLELGLPPGWEIIDELADARLRRQAIEEVLNSTATSEIRTLTNRLSKGDSTRRVSALIQETVDQFYHIFRQTDRSAWHRETGLHPLPSDVLAETIDQLRDVEMPDHKSVLGQHLKGCEAVVAHDWDQFIHTGVAKCLAHEQTTYYGREIPPAAQEVYGRLIDHAGACLIGQLTDRTAATWEVLAAFDRVYRNLKQRERGLRFEDVTERLATVFGVGGTSSDALGHLAYRLDSDISHLLLDEFQDTSLPQWQVLQPFARKITQAAGDTSFFAVGDVKQAIYGWRGGVAEIFNAIDEQLRDVVSATLATSFRSSQIVIDAVNKLFAGIPSHPNLQQDEPTIRNWCTAVETHTTARTLPGHVTLESSAGPSEDDSVDMKQSIILCAADRVERITAAAPDARVGVLVRTNKHIARIIAELRDRDIEASEESGNPLTDSAAVLVLLSLLRLAEHPGDTIARFHVAHSPLGVAFGLTGHNDGSRAADLAFDLRRQLIDDGYGPALDRWSRLLIGSCSRRDITRLGQLVDLAYQFQEQATLRPGDFIQFVEQEKVQDPSSAPVRVMSVHQAKGLQFDAVVLPLWPDRGLLGVPPKFVTGASAATSPPELVSVYANRDQLPLLPDDFRRAFDETRADSIREELCVLYVAVTRAIHALHIVIPPTTGSEANLPRNFAGLVRAGLADGVRAEPSTVLYERGDQNWPAEKAGDEDTTADRAPKPEPQGEPPLQVRLAPMTGGRSRGLGRVAPSQGESEPVRMSQLVQGPQSAAMDRGTLIHGWFEQIAWLDDGPPEEQRLRGIARRQGFDDEEIERHLDSFRRMLARPAVADLLSQRTYRSPGELPLPQPVLDELTAESFTLDVSQERPVAVRLEGDLLTGTIDRLVLLRRGWQVIAADIIDFKTDSVGEADAADLQRTAHYRRQLESYAVAIAQVYRLEPGRIATRLLFVEPGEVVTV